MLAGPGHKLSSVLLLAEVPILLVTLGLLAWALHILSQSISLNDNSYGYAYGFPADQLITETYTQTVTGYRSSSVSPAELRTVSASAYTVIGLDRHSTPYTNPAVTYTLGPFTYGIEPTATKERVVTVSGLQGIPHRRRRNLHEQEVLSSQPTITAAPALQPRQQRTSNTGDSSAPPARLDGLHFWSLSSSSPQSWAQYETLSVNRGFHGYFQEVGIDYIYKSDSLSTERVLPRVRALTALVVLALVSIVGRLGCTVAYFFVSRKRKVVPDGGDIISKEQVESQSTTSTGSGTKVEEDDESKDPNNVVNHRVSAILLWLNGAFTLLLLLIYIPFWAIYGSWTHRSAEIIKADAEFKTDVNLGYNNLNNILHTVPWEGTPTALIVFWTLAVLTSMFVSLSGFCTGRRSATRKRIQKG